jgi:hypothetical protein
LCPIHETRKEKKNCIIIGFPLTFSQKREVLISSWKIQKKTCSLSLSLSPSLAQTQTHTHKDLIKERTMKTKKTRYITGNK